MYTFSELISNIRKVGKIDSRKMQGQIAFSCNNVRCIIYLMTSYDSLVVFYDIAIDGRSYKLLTFSFHLL